MRSSQLAYASAPPGPVAVGAGSRGGTGASPRPLSLELIEKLLKLEASVRLQEAHSRNWFTGMSPAAYAVNGLLPRAHYLCGAWWRYVTARVRAFRQPDGRRDGKCCRAGACAAARRRRRAAHR